ncbi:MAG: hypothetical protein L6Q98_19420 [Anaerolineae bacterium]|nr:hypothetical protein [Anaerolineae bacterium]NUQ05985.1 hypothetical protein [Anaerolineae bacterium]
MSALSGSRPAAPRRADLLVLALAALLLIWRILIQVHSPTHQQADAVWYLSQTYALLRGDWLTSLFGHSAFQPYLLPYLYGVVSLPFFAVFGASQHSLALWNALLLMIIALLTLRLCDRFGIRALSQRAVLVAAFLTSPTLYGPRPEVLNVALMLVMLNLVCGAHSVGARRAVTLGVLAAAAGLIQPVGGVFSLCLMGVASMARRWSWRTFALLLLSAALTVALLYGPVILVDPALWLEQFFFTFRDGDGRGQIDLLLVVKYALYTPFPYLLYGLMLLSRARASRSARAALGEIGMMAVLIAALLPFSRSYYYPYLLVFVVWRLADSGGAVPRRRQNAAVLGLLILMPLFSHYYPTAQHLENPAYGGQARRVIDAARAVVEEEQDGLIWVEAQIGMVAIQHPQARLYFSYIARLNGAPIRLGEDDVMLFTTRSAAEDALLNLAHTRDEIVITEVIAGSERGLFIFEPFRFERGQPLGLWMLRLNLER